jgi:hypothetical protein
VVYPRRSTVKLGPSSTSWDLISPPHCTLYNTGNRFRKRSLFIGIDRISKVRVPGAGCPGDHVWRQCLYEVLFIYRNRLHYTTENNCQKVEVPGTITLEKWGCPGTKAPMITTPMALLIDHQLNESDFSRKFGSINL